MPRVRLLVTIDPVEQRVERALQADLVCRTKQGFSGPGLPAQPWCSHRGKTHTLAADRGADGADDERRHPAGRGRGAILRGRAGGRRLEQANAVRGLHKRFTRPRASIAWPSGPASPRGYRIDLRTVSVNRRRGPASLPAARTRRGCRSPGTIRQKPPQLCRDLRRTAQFGRLGPRQD